MEGQGRVALAEAKHFRTRDYLVYFVAERLEGLALKMGRLTQFGLSISTTDKYDRYRKDILSNRQLWLGRVRAELTEDYLLSLEQKLASNPGAQIEVMDGLFMLECSKIAGAGSVYHALIGTLAPKQTVRLCLSRLQDEVMRKLGQIRRFIDAKGSRATEAIVFFCGIDEWEPEWAEVWSTLEDEGQQ